MKRFICLILMLLLLTPAAFADGEQLTFYMEDVSGNVGDTVTVVGAVKNAPECASFQIIMTYDTDVLEPVSCSKLDVGGMFMKNIEYTYKGQPAVNVLSAAAQKVLSGDMKLFSVEFKIIAETPGEHGTAIQVVKQDFFDPTPTRITPIVEPCTIYVGSDTPAPSGDGEGGTTDPDDETSTPDNETSTPDDETSTPDNETSTPDDETSTPGGETTDPDDGENNSSPQTGNTRPSTGDGYTENNTENSDGEVSTPTDPDEDTSASTTPEEPKKEDDKTPTGSWVVDESNDDLYHVEEDGTTTVYVPEYVETPEPGKVTEVILKDKETGEEAGSIKGEGKEDGSFEVVEQDLIKDRVEKTGFPVWGWVLIGVAAAAAAAAAAWYFLTFRKKTSEK